MIKFLIIWSLSISHIANAKEHRHEHAAHEHGSGTLSIAFDGAKGLVDLKIPSESIIGFEHVAKTKADKNKVVQAEANLEKSISEMLVLDSKLSCAIKKEKFEIKQDGSHSEVLVQFSISCASSPVGSKIVFNFQKVFPSIKDLDVQVLAGNLQKSIEVKSSGVELELK